MGAFKCNIASSYEYFNFITGIFFEMGSGYLFMASVLLLNSVPWCQPKVFVGALHKNSIRWSPIENGFKKVSIG